MKKNLFSLLFTAIVGIVIYYFMLPPLNLHSPTFWVYFITMLIIFSMCVLFNSFGSKKQLTTSNKLLTGIAISIFSIVICIFVVNFFLSPLFQAKSYAKRINVQEGADFIKEVPAVDFNSLPLLDKSSSQKLGDRVMGQMPELVSQFYVSSLYTQINYNDTIIRVTPLGYNGFFKYLANRDEGVKGYIMVNSVTGESTLVKLEKGMKYVPSAILNEDLNRYLRFKYPTKIFGDMNFEIDNDGDPYWIVPVIKYAGVGLKREIVSVIILDPISGDSKEYKIEDVPSWVDHVYSADLIIEQVDDWGQYKNGFLNSIFGQKNVVQTTTGYNYTTMNDDVYLYTGITSVSSDESNIGFILTNMRTKETNFYSVPGAEEYSAMESAKGQVQQMNYNATFPLLINLNNRPTYLLSLKDAAGLVKMYAFVDVEDYQKVVITDSSKGIKVAAENYLANVDLNKESSSSISKEIEISSITQATIDGTSYYYIVDQDNQKYYVSIKVSKNKLPFLKTGDKITISYNNEKEVIEIVSLK
ncbi:MAG: hypothetical protein PUC82_00655 [bacterium]|nr:hypothetical protein [bacterium]